MQDQVSGRRDHGTAELWEKHSPQSRGKLLNVWPDTVAQDVASFELP